jgi:1-acyl-sn-glycerol-3-phosphate acyltransferase
MSDPRRTSPPLRATPGRPGRAGRDPAGKRALFGPGAEHHRPAEPAPAPDIDHPREAGDDAVDDTTVNVVSLSRGAGALDADAGRLSDVDHWGRSERTRALVRQLYGPLYERWFRVEWEGLEHIPKEGGALLVANHAGAIPSDAPAIMHGIETELGRPVYGLAEHLFKAVPVIGTLWSRTGGVAAHPDNAYRLLHDEQQLAVVFPEGTKGTGKRFSDRYRLARFGRGGFVAIAMRAGVPVIPIAVVGAEESMPIVWSSRRLAKLLNLPYVPLTANMLAFGPLGLVLYFPAKFRIRVLPPVHFDVPSGEERYSRARVMEASETIRGQIQEALYDMLRKRRSVWFG